MSASVLEEVATRLVGELSGRAQRIALGDKAAPMFAVSGTYLDELQAVALLARALRDVDAILTSTRPPAPPPADFEGLLAIAWQATQEAGTPTSVGDAVVAAMRHYAATGRGPAE